MRRAVAVTAAIVSGLLPAGCGDDTPAGPESVPATWTVPEDTCARLDLVGRLAAAGEDDGSARDAEVGPGEALCSAAAGETTVEVRARTGATAADVDRLWSDARNQAGPPETWEQAFGPVATASPEPADWGERAESVTYTSVQRSVDVDLLDGIRVQHAEVVGDDNLVVRVTVYVTTAGGEPEAATTRAERIGAAVAGSVPEALERG